MKTKKELAKFIVENNEDCGMDTYFSDDRRSALTTFEYR